MDTEEALKRIKTHPRLHRYLFARQGVTEADVVEWLQNRDGGVALRLVAEGDLEAVARLCDKYPITRRREKGVTF